MEKSDHYFKRKFYMNNLIAPTISDVRKELGNDLAEMYFSICPQSMQPVLGISPYLTGTADDLWMSPSDVLIGKVCLKPPVTGKYMKALTHQGVLLIGQDIEKKFWNEAELQKQKALAEQEKTLKFVAALDKSQALEKVRIEEQKKLIEEKDQRQIEFSKKLERELQLLQNKLKTEFDHVLRREKRNQNDEWQDKLKVAVADTVTRLTTDFLREFGEQAEKLHKQFQLEEKKEKLKHQFDLHEVRKNCQESFTQLKHQLQCKNIANIMYILCAERRKCLSEKSKMESSYQKRIKQVQNLLVNKEVQVTGLTMERDEKIKQLHLREECLKEILRQYQKFINFALRSCPTQAEFLLNVEKMMLFELAQDVTKITDKHGKRLAKDLCPWKSDTEVGNSNDLQRTLIANDYHQCYNETDPPITEHNIESSDYLPAFHYNKRMYVREEFRNMMSCGIEVSPSNLIWNKDVEDLMHDLRSTDQNNDMTPHVEHKGVTMELDVNKRHVPVSSEIRQTSMELAQSSDDLLLPACETPPSTLLHDTELELHQLSETPQYKTSDTTMFENVKKSCCSRCTQTHVKPGSCESVNYFAIPHDSLIKHRTSTAPKPKVLKDRNDLQLSRLSLARDSIILNRLHTMNTKHKKHDTKAKNVTASLVLPISEKYSGGDVDKLRMVQNLSKLSLTKDSLQLLRSQSMMKNKMESKESIEIKNGIGTNFSESRVTKVSHFEVLELEEKSKKKDNSLSATDSPWLTYGYKTNGEPAAEVQQCILKSKAAQIIGDPKLTVHIEKQKDFALHRANSMLSIFRKQPSLIKLFTSCTK